MSGSRDVAKALGIKPSVVGDVFEEILARVGQGEQIRIKGFGTFQARVYPGRTLTSPKVNDGKPIAFGDSVTLKFRQAQTAKQRLNRKGASPKALEKGAEKAATKAAKKAAKVASKGKLNKTETKKAEKAAKAPKKAAKKKSKDKAVDADMYASEAAADLAALATSPANEEQLELTHAEGASAE